MTTIENATSTADNIKEIEWVQTQIKAELQQFKKDFFYSKEADGNVSYDMKTVKSYLTQLKDKNWESLTSTNSSARIMAVQIALETMGYDVGKIDGIFGNTTKNKITEFQSANNLQADGQPGKNTINKLLEKISTDTIGEKLSTDTISIPKEIENLKNDNIVVRSGFINGFSTYKTQDYSYKVVNKVVERTPNQQTSLVEIPVGEIFKDGKRQEKNILSPSPLADLPKKTAKITEEEKTPAQKKEIEKSDQKPIGTAQVKERINNFVNDKLFEKREREKENTYMINGVSVPKEIKEVYDNILSLNKTRFEEGLTEFQVGEYLYKIKNNVLEREHKAIPIGEIFKDGKRQEKNILLPSPSADLSKVTAKIITDKSKLIDPKTTEDEQISQTDKSKLIDPKTTEDEQISQIENKENLTIEM